MSIRKETIVLTAAQRESVKSYHDTAIGAQKIMDEFCLWARTNGREDDPDVIDTYELAWRNHRDLVAMTNRVAASGVTIPPAWIELQIQRTDQFKAEYRDLRNGVTREPGDCDTTAPEPTAGPWGRHAVLPQFPPESEGSAPTPAA